MDNHQWKFSRWRENVQGILTLTSEPIMHKNNTLIDIKRKLFRRNKKYNSLMVLFACEMVTLTYVMSMAAKIRWSLYDISMSSLYLAD